MKIQSNFFKSIGFRNIQKIDFLHCYKCTCTLIMNTALKKVQNHKISQYCRFLIIREHLIPQFNAFTSNREDIKSQRPNFLHKTIQFIFVRKLIAGF